MEDQIELHEEIAFNPLDSLEDVLNDHNWIYTRLRDDTLMVEVAGQSCQYKMLFTWQETMGALQLHCQYDMEVKAEKMALGASAVMDMNADLWMGHFEITREHHAPCFRHTCLLRGRNGKSDYDLIEDLVDISLAQCERYQTVFHMLCDESLPSIDTLSFAMMETEGES